MILKEELKIYSYDNIVEGAEITILKTKYFDNEKGKDIEFLDGVLKSIEVKIDIIILKIEIEKLDVVIFEIKKENDLFKIFKNKLKGYNDV